MPASRCGLLVALPLLAGCPDASPPDASGQQPSASAATTSSVGAAPSASASAKPMLDVELAVARVVATAPAKRALKEHPDYKPQLEHAGGLLFITFAPDQPEEHVAYPKLRIQRRTGEIEAESLCEEGGWVPVERRDLEDRALEHALSLPEVSGLGRQLARTSNQRVRLTLRVENCKDRPRDEVQLYVGEAHDDHTVRTFTLLVKGPKLDVSVANMGENEFTPYATWSKSPRAARLR